MILQWLHLTKKLLLDNIYVPLENKMNSYEHSDKRITAEACGKKNQIELW